MLLLPGVGTVDDLRRAHDAGASVARIATHCTEADVSVQHFAAARDLGMETVGFLMLAHRLDPAELAGQARIMVDAGAQCVYVVDSAGALVLARRAGPGPGPGRGDRPATRRSASTGTRTCRWAWPTRCSPRRRARPRSTARCARSAPGPATRPTEVLAATFDRLGIRTGVDVQACSPRAEEVVRPIIPRLPWMDRSSIVQGYAGVYSLLPAARRSGRPSGTACPRTTILQRVGEAGYVGGQEDMIIDVALELLREQEGARAWRRLAGVRGGPAGGDGPLTAWLTDEMVLPPARRCRRTA